MSDDVWAKAYAKLIKDENRQLRVSLPTLREAYEKSAEATFLLKQLLVLEGGEVLSEVEDRKEDIL